MFDIKRKQSRIFYGLKIWVEEKHNISIRKIFAGKSAGSRLDNVNNNA